MYVHVIILFPIFLCSGWAQPVQKGTKVTKSFTVGAWVYQSWKSVGINRNNSGEQKQLSKDATSLI